MRKRNNPRTFGQRRPYIAPSVRRARRHNRIAAAILTAAGLALTLGCYSLMGMASGEYGQRWGDLTGAAMLAGIAAFACFMVAATAALES